MQKWKTQGSVKTKAERFKTTLSMQLKRPSWMTSMALASATDIRHCAKCSIRSDRTIRSSHRKKEKKISINLQCYSECDNCVHGSYGSPLGLPVAIQLTYVISMHFSITLAPLKFWSAYLGCPIFCYENKGKSRKWAMPISGGVLFSVVRILTVFSFFAVAIKIMMKF